MCTPLFMGGSLVAFHTNLGAYIRSQHTPAVKRRPRLSLNIFISKYKTPTMISKKEKIRVVGNTIDQLIPKHKFLISIPAKKKKLNSFIIGTFRHD